MKAQNKNVESVEQYLVDGCMRCKYGGTPQCKVLKWVDEIQLLREIVLETGLIEEIKWSVPVYTYNGKNVVTVNALKESANIGFFKGVLLADEYKLLQQQGNLQSDRLMKFQTINEINACREQIKAYVLEAIELEKEGKKVVFKKELEPIPAELHDFFEADTNWKIAFYALTPGRQRGYILYFSQAKQPQTRIARILKCKERIFNGKGLQDTID
jgi:uncharacterized protein YdeI (YjbR/CyaY-like superfamily)